ncbi:hypothetical protein [Olsenella profusa]|uniref:DUF559 domain-containing protein n=1 Tax=Olsenella profusa TaxID=138595 RepID=A0ABS2F3J5_9ACTN|nr:hypothetical protein [Olsenella profusa]MBM6775387.1 hypothetical protein [Olsenella profusa]
MLLSHLSALEALRRQGTSALLDASESDAPPVPDVAPTHAELTERLGSDPALRGLEGPVDLLTTGARGHARTSTVTTHQQTTSLPPGALLRLSDDVWCTSPEQLAVQMAPRLTKLELVALLAELMGLYAIEPTTEDGMVQRDVPLATPENVGAHLDALGPVRGTAQVRRALALTPVRSGSPRETKLTLRLSLKPALGGWHLNVLSLNSSVEVQRIDRAMTCGVRRPDIVIGGRDGQVVALEYHGRRHDAPERLAQDAARTNELRAIGVGEYVVRREQYRDLAYMDGLVERIRADLHLPRVGLAPEERKRRRQLRQELYHELECIDGTHWDGRERARRAAEQEVAAEGGWDVVPVEAYGLG